MKRLAGLAAALALLAAPAQAAAPARMLVTADEWMLLELWPLKASGSRGVYGGSLRSEAGRLGVLLTQEMLLRGHLLEPEMLRRIAEYLGVTPEE